MHNNRNNRETVIIPQDYNRTNKIYNRCIPKQYYFLCCSLKLLV